MSTLRNHAELVQRLKSQDYEAIAKRMTATPEIIDMQHALMGLMSEGGELADQLKRHIAYGTELDLVNIMEENGDLLWYIQLFLHAAGYTVTQAVNVNSSKLIKRYGTEFSEDAAVNRDTDAERVILEAEQSGSGVANIREGSIISFGGGWIKALGETMDMPVDYGTLIDLQHRDGDLFYAQPAGHVGGFCESWKHLGGSSDIVSWRLAARNT